MQSVPLHYNFFFPHQCSLPVGEDYYTLSQDITIEPGEQSKTFEIQILNDEILESSEDISLMLLVFGSSLEFILPGDPSDAKLVIVDDEFCKWALGILLMYIRIYAVESAWL